MQNIAAKCGGFNGGLENALAAGWKGEEIWKKGRGGGRTPWVSGYGAVAIDPYP